MGDRVWQVQKQLEDLQSHCESASEVKPSLKQLRHSLLLHLGHF